MNPMTHDLSKLPTWAKERIRVLEMRVTEANARIAILFGATPTNTSWGDDPGRHPHYLPSNATIRFELGIGDDHIDVHIEREDLYINGQRRLAVYPEAANAVRISLKPI